MHSTKLFTRYCGILLCLLFSLEAWAEPALPVPGPPSVGAGSYILVAHESGQVIAAQNADQRMEPASLTKLMTAYIVFSELKAGHIHLEDGVPISENAWRTGGSKTFVQVGTRVKLDDLIKGMIVQSGNDATVALAEYLGGSEAGFASMMNAHAQRLDMISSHFVNGSGLPDPAHYTTARDMATLASAIVNDFPSYYGYYAIRSFAYNGIDQPNRNRLLQLDPRADGFKTGHTESAGYCLVGSAKDNGTRLISVVMKTASDDARVSASQTLFNYGFRFFRTYKIYEAGKVLSEAPIWKGEADVVQVIAKKDVYVTIHNGKYDQLKSVLNINNPLVAPLSTETAVGKAEISLGDQKLAEVPIYPVKSVPEGGLVKRLSDDMMLYFK